MREEDAASSRATSLYGDHEGSSSSHLPFGSTAYLNSESKYSLSQDVGVYSSRGREGRFTKEEDDYLHEDPGAQALPREGRARYMTESRSFRGSSWSGGRFCNVFALGLIGAALLGIFLGE